MFKNLAAILTALFAASVAVPSARADLVSTLTVDGCSAGSCGAGPFGTVTVHDVDADTVLVTLNLAADEVIAITGAGSPFGFNLDKSASLVASTLSIGGVTTGPSLNGSNTFAGGLGTFAETIQCNVKADCGSGTSAMLGTPLTFELFNAGGLSTADFIANSSGFLFGADIGIVNSVGAVTATGVVGAPVPEPGSLTSLTGLLLVLGAIRYVQAARRV